MDDPHNPDQEHLVAPPLVPGDEDLAVGQRPFTDFGQFGYGMIDTRVLEQDVIWVNIAGKPMFLIDMPQDYLRNVIGFLRRNAHEWWQREVLFDSLETALLDTVDEAEEAAASAAHRNRLLDLGPSDWIEATPLMRRLRDLADSGGAS